MNPSTWVPAGGNPSGRRSCSELTQAGSAIAITSRTQTGAEIASPLPVRARRMYHDRIDRQNWLSCLKHGPILAVTQEQAERDHAAGKRCPICVKEVADANQS